ncbi:MAG: hypothetical protein QW265_04675 [Candidatus Bathyarchaeia archaeon]
MNSGLSEHKGEILALGDLILDIAICTLNYPKRGLEASINSMEVRGGGSSTNFAVAMHRMGTK